jgi:hypothetical protein
MPDRARRDDTDRQIWTQPQTGLSADSKTRSLDHEVGGGGVVLANRDADLVLADLKMLSIAEVDGDLDCLTGRYLAARQRCEAEPPAASIGRVDVSQEAERDRCAFEFVGPVGHYDGRTKRFVRIELKKASAAKRTLKSLRCSATHA